MERWRRQETLSRGAWWTRKRSTLDKIALVGALQSSSGNAFNADTAQVVAALERSIKGTFEVYRAWPMDAHSSP